MSTLNVAHFFPCNFQLILTFAGVLASFVAYLQNSYGSAPINLSRRAGLRLRKPPWEVPLVGSIKSGLVHRR